MIRREQTVTWGKWGVSTSTPGMGGEPCVLHVYIRHERPGFPDLWQHGDGYGKVFPNSDTAFRWALEHGYLQRYYRAKKYKKFYCRIHNRLSWGLDYCMYCRMLKP